MQNVEIDYIGIVFDDNYTERDFTDFAQKKLVDASTGQIIGVNVEPYQYSFHNSYGVESVGVWSTACDNFYPQVLKADAKVNRLDLAINLEVADVDKAWEELYLKARKWREEDTQAPKLTSEEGKNFGRKGDSYFRLGGDSTDKCARVYKNRPNGNGPQYLRIEVQFRRDLARKAWDDLASRKFHTEALKDEISGIVNRYYEPVLAGVIPETSNQDYFEPYVKREPDQSERKAWLVRQVLPAILNHFDATGENLVDFITDEFEAVMMKRAESNAKASEKPNIYEARLKFVERKKAIRENGPDYAALQFPIEKKKRGRKPAQKPVVSDLKV